MRVLALALAGIGDALMFTPAATILKRRRPDVRLDALCMFRGVKDIYDRTALFDETTHFDFLKEGAFGSLKFLASLRGEYDATINVYPTNRREYNLVARLIGAKTRVAARYLRQDAANLGFLNNLRVTESDDRHNATENVKLVEALFGFDADEAPPYSFPLSEEDVAFAERFLEERGWRNETLVGFHPGCSTLKNHEKRRWAPERFSALAKRLIEERGAAVLVFGGPEERELKGRVVAGVGSERCVAVESGNLAQSAALIKRCRAFATNDSSLMHVASATGTPTAAVIGPTNPNYIRPWRVPHRIVSLGLACAPCFVYSPRPLTCAREDVKFKCVRELGVDLAYDAVVELLDGAEPR
ncbi:MAG: glycosyltransferase family 9 protein [Ignavibacteriales bacterium]|nr:glycosyltransferase family 9 protein [Ignavibacteriales bacterium]